jgi:Spy/CpxP family protein refolding chaperone
MQTRRFSALTPVLAGISAALLIQASAMAEPAPVPPGPAAEAPAPKAPRPGHPDGKWHRPHPGRAAHQYNAAMVVPGFGPLSQQFVETLSLTSAQKTKLDEAVSADKARRQARRAEMQAHFKAIQAQLEQGKLDPHAAAKVMAERRAADAKADEAVTQKWIAVWDALDAAQHKKIVEQMSARAKRMAERHQARTAS